MEEEGMFNWEVRSEMTHEQDISLTDEFPSLETVNTLIEMGQDLTIACSTTSQDE